MARLPHRAPRMMKTDSRAALTDSILWMRGAAHFPTSPVLGSWNLHSKFALGGGSWGTRKHSSCLASTPSMRCSMTKCGPRRQVFGDCLQGDGLYLSIGKGLTGQTRRQGEIQHYVRLPTSLRCDGPSIGDGRTESRNGAICSISCQETTWQPALTVPSGSMRSSAYEPRWMVCPL